ncbi:MAG: glycosyltransferase [Ferruginibacter sp.]
MSTYGKNINKTNVNKKVLVAPLDWGLGHATRCVPLIRSLLAEGFDVLPAADETGALLLQKEFPALTVLPLRGYNIRYSKYKRLFFFKMLLQVPKILAAIRHERKWLKTIIGQHAIDIVISDNRFGLRNKKAHCIFMTHQLFIKTGNRFTEKIAQKINYRYINRFDECWVPDEPGQGNLAGELSHPATFPRIPVTYIGPLSRFRKLPADHKTGLLVILSGPEPQRTFFENILLAQLRSLQEKVVLVRGLPGAPPEVGVRADNVTVINHLPASELNELICSAKTVIARSGYSSVMDLAMLQQQAILIPTPGQAEQEYLAKYLSGKKYCIIQDQDGFDLQKALHDLNRDVLVPFPERGRDLLQEAIMTLR